MAFISLYFIFSYCFMFLISTFVSYTIRKGHCLHVYNKFQLRSTTSNIIINKSQMESLMQRILDLNNGKYSLSPSTGFNVTLPFESNGYRLGMIRSSMIPYFEQFPDIFMVNKDKICIHSSIDSLNMTIKTETIARATQKWKKDGIIKGWRNELLPIVSSFTSSPHFLLERAAVPFFGLKAYGVHVNGFTRNKKTGEISHMWVGKRSKTKSLWPSMFDHIVAGGQPYGLTPYENVVKECLEEANIPENIAMKAKSVGAVSYTFMDETQIKRDVLFCFDLELDTSFVPRPVDGEVESFRLESVEWVLNKVIQGGSEGYKPNCNLVIIDFFIRHGIISSDSIGYLELVSALRGEECS